MNENQSHRLQLHLDNVN